MYGSVLLQLIQVYVQKSISTTFPLKPAKVSGCVLSQPVAPLSDGPVFLVGSLCSLLDSPEDHGK